MNRETKARRSALEKLDRHLPRLSSQDPFEVKRAVERMYEAMVVISGDNMLDFCELCLLELADLDKSSARFLQDMIANYSDRPEMITEKQAQWIFDLSRRVRKAREAPGYTEEIQHVGTVFKITRHSGGRWLLSQDRRMISHHATIEEARAAVYAIQPLPDTDPSPVPSADQPARTLH